MLELADRMLGYDQLSDAYRYVVLAEAIGGFDDGMLGTIRQTGEKVKTAADELIEKADKLCDEGKYAQAVEAYSQVSGLRKMGPSKVATRKLIDLERNPAVRASMREVKASQRLERVLDVIDIASMQIEVVGGDAPAVCPVDGESEAGVPGVVGVEADDGTDYAVFPPADSVTAGGTLAASEEDTADLGLSEVEVALLLNLCERIKFIDALDSVAQHYGDTASGQRAQKLTARLRASDEFMDGLEEHRREEQAMECISMARQYEQVGNRRIAIEMYQEALELSPQSEWGAAAKEALVTLKE